MYRLKAWLGGVMFSIKYKLALLWATAKAMFAFSKMVCTELWRICLDGTDRRFNRFAKSTGAFYPIMLLGVTIMVTFIMAMIVINFLGAAYPDTYVKLQALGNGSAVPTMTSGDKSLMALSTMLFTVMAIFAILSFMILMITIGAKAGQGQGRSKGSGRGR